jgi:hypothetical protein
MSQETSPQKGLVLSACKIIPFYCAYINDTFYTTWRRYWSAEESDMNHAGFDPIIRDIGRIAFMAGYLDGILGNKVLSEGLFDKLFSWCVHFCELSYCNYSNSEIWDTKTRSQVEETVLWILGQIRAGEMIDMETTRGIELAKKLATPTMLPFQAPQPITRETPNVLSDPFAD